MEQPKQEVAGFNERHHRRDADTSAAFETVRTGARHLLATSEAQLTQLPTIRGAFSLENRGRALAA